MLRLIAILSPSLPVPATAHGAVGSLHYLPLKMFGANVWSNQARCMLPTAHLSLPVSLSPCWLRCLGCSILRLALTQKHMVERWRETSDAGRAARKAGRPDSLTPHSQRALQTRKHLPRPSFGQAPGHGNHKSTDRGSVFTGWPSAPICQPEQVLTH